jgi:amino acid adenylation domain-containing protein
MQYPEVVTAPPAPVRRVTAAELPLRPVSFNPCKAGLAPADVEGRRAAWLASNLTLRQFLYWLEESLHPDLPLSQNLFLYTLPEELAPHLEESWTLFSAAADGARSRLRIRAGVPTLDFGCEPEPLAWIDIDGNTPPTEDAIGEAVFALVDPWWTSFRPGESQVRHLGIRFADGRTFWLLTASHLIVDGLGFNLMLNGMIDLMHAFARGETPPVPVLPSFEQNMRMEREKELTSGLYDNRVDWRAIVGEDIPGFRTFGTDERPNPVRRTKASPALSPAQVDSLMATVQRPELYFRSIDASMANFFTALTALWIWHHGGHPSVLFGVPFHGRSAEESNLFGFKSEVLPLRLDLDPTMRFCDLVQQVHHRLRDVLKYRGLSIDNPGHRPVIHAQSNFMFQRGRLAAARFPLSRVEIPRHTAQPESVHFLQFNDAAVPGGIKCVLSTHSATADFTDGAQIGNGYLSAFESLVSDPLQRLCDVSFIDPETRSFFEVREHPRTDAAPDLAWLSRWAASASSQLAQQPAAVIHADETLSHAQLCEDAGRWAAFFQSRGLSAGDRVIVIGRSSNTLAAVVLALFSRNLTYIPVRADAPSDEILDTLHTLRPGCVLVDANGPEDIRTGASKAGFDVVDLNRSILDGYSPVPLRDPDPERIAHIFHTSGSTGKAKPIAVTHRALASFIDSWITANSLRPGEVFFHFYAITFDPWLSVLIPALILRGTCVCGEQHQPPAPNQLADILKAHRVTTLCTPTAYFHALRDWVTPHHVKRLIVGGEALAADKAMVFVRNSPHTLLVNAYGPTETTVWSSVLTVNSEHRAGVPIGRPLPTCGYRVCDQFGHPTPFGVPGELWIGGPQLAAGYVDQPDLTHRAFVIVDGTRWYRTGDLVRWRRDGDLDFLGRLDRQVKIRGHRIEPGEIEVRLRALDDIADAVVAPLERDGVASLCAWVIAADPQSLPLASTVKARLLLTVPDYKVPRWFIYVGAFPRNPNGKIAIDQLPPPTAEAAQPTEDRLPSLTLWDLRFIFEKTLGTSRIGVADNFFDLGGDSLRLIELLGAIEGHFGNRLEPNDIIDLPTIGQLAPLLETRRQRAANLIVELKPGNGPPLWCIPGAGGIGVEFYALARRLEGMNPVLVLRSSGTDGHAHPPVSLDALLEEHVGNIQRHRQVSAETGPVHLAGYSLGGVFAWEVAQRLHNAGVPVGRIVLIDSHAATAAARKLLLRTRPTLRDRLFRQSSATRRKQIRVLQAELDAALRDGRIMAAEPLGEYNRLVQATHSQDIEAHPAGFETTYISASNSDRHPQIEIWRQLATNLTVRTVQGDHEGDDAIIREPKVAAVATIVAQVLTVSANG